ncbi:[NiFe]-hydrogenase assembly chaperone HybE [Rhodopseudomonas pseudopalustris]|uniref:[NiFe] hydrogenase assembly chaperone, HybE family n=1 Tax=Rhodopseudomonas pseudopalustris TaxID=1513892 RepID=A0A1H8NMG1_9BRAD|nr:[NiFe]-hydrogenase assembly chaperone HybE [Rhodopseudomonas pseudopalustris]SEO30588.1 [NiFe] hydrogenase assembly chaperone, HybE family [Rhodopseudomonas pseudopalustris]
MTAEPGPDRDASARAAGEALAARYREAEPAMRDLPVYNPALSVAAIGFRATDDDAIGVVVTPWFMNLVRIPAPGSAADAQHGAVVSRALPAGVLDFTIGLLDGFGPVESCSLFSPMFGFADQQAAETTARAALAAVLDPNFTADPKPEPAARQPGAPAVALDRRRFLRGALSESRP